MPCTPETVRPLLEGLPATTRKSEFGGDAYLVGRTRFAALTGSSLVLHLPGPALTTALQSGHARPFVSMGAAGRNGWVEVHLANVDLDFITPLVQAAHAAAGHARGRSPARKPTRARRTRPRTRK